MVIPLTAARTTELAARRRNLAAFISADPISVEFKRYPQTSDGAGAWTKGSVVDVPAQTARLVPYKRRLASLSDDIPAGDIPNVQYSLVGYWNMDVERWDEFFYNEAWYKVTGMEPNSERTEYNDRVTVLVQLRDASNSG